MTDPIPAARTPRMLSMPGWRRFSAALGLMVTTAGIAEAERLPLTRHTRADGLVDDAVSAVTEDARGFLWIGTVAGVSRFDGSLFRTYQVRDDRVLHAINAIVQTRNGDVWFATNGGGVARIAHDARRSASAQPALARYRLGQERRPNRVNALVEDLDGALWAATDGGLFRLPPSGEAFARVELGIDGLADEALYVPAAVLDPDGDLWLGTEHGLLRRSPDGTSARMTLAGIANQSVVRMAIDQEGRIWIATRADLRVLRPPPRRAALDGRQPEEGRSDDVQPMLSASPCDLVDGRLLFPDLPGESCAVTVAHGLPAGRVPALSVAPDGRLLIGTTRGGIGEIVDGHVRTIDASHDRYSLAGITGDRHGNLWLASDSGLLRLARDGLVTFASDDGLRGLVRRIFSGRGGLYVVTDDESIYELEGTRFRGGRPEYPRGAGLPTWGSLPVQDPARGWWLPTNAGLCRYDADDHATALARARPGHCLTTRDGLPSNDIAHARFDTSGALWVATRSTGGPVLARRDATTTTRFTIVDVDGIAPLSTPVDLVDDSDGIMWVGFRDGGVARCMASLCEGVIATSSVSRLLVDRIGRLWIATSTGLLRVDERRGPLSVARHYTSRDGLSSDSTYGLAEDRLGRVYVGTNVGVDRLDPASGAVRRFTEVDGLEAGAVVAAHADVHGRLWFGTRHAVSMYVPGDDVERMPSAPSIAFVRTRNSEWPVPEFGAIRVDGVSLPSQDAPIEIGFFAIDPARPARLQYRLRGAGEWNDAGPASTAVYPRLAPGTYDFDVRTLNEGGAASEAIASVQFRVPPPFWLRWPFLTIGGALVAALAYLVHRVRLGRIVALERVRTHIATDLHDDIGSTLTRIAMLAERTRRRGTIGRELDAPLDTIATASRDLVDTMSDIVWAVNPRHDSLSDLTHRMRRFAGETLGEAGVAMSFAAPDEDLDRTLGPEWRRDVYLVLKECVTNVVKHAGATAVEIICRIDGDRLRLRVSDNGRGFDSGAPTDGAGLTNLRTRTARVGGALAIASTPGAGTVVTLTVELKRSIPSSTLRT